MQTLYKDVDGILNIKICKFFQLHLITTFLFLNIKAISY